MQQEIQQLKDLPLAQLIEAPLTAVITAQASSALTTASFIERIGFQRRPDSTQAADDGSEREPFAADSEYDLRLATLTFKKEVAKKVEPEQLNAEGQPKYEKAEETVTVVAPLLGFVNVPSFEIDAMDWNFQVKLKSLQTLAIDTSRTSTTTVKASSASSLGIALKVFNLNVNTNMSVQSTTTTKFGLRYGETHESEYNLQIAIKARQAPPPKGIERLLGIAEALAKSSQDAADKVAASA
jgi:hypothetical protein